MPRLCNMIGASTFFWQQWQQRYRVSAHVSICASSDVLNFHDFTQPRSTAWSCSLSAWCLWSCSRSSSAASFSKPIGAGVVAVAALLHRPLFVPHGPPGSEAAAPWRVSDLWARTGSTYAQHSGPCPRKNLWIWTIVPVSLSIGPDPKFELFEEDADTQHPYACFLKMWNVSSKIMKRQRQ